jgi:hypothetical protein
MIFVPMHFHATFKNLSCSPPFPTGKTPRSQVLVKSDLLLVVNPLITLGGKEEEPMLSNFKLLTKN